MVAEASSGSTSIAMALACAQLGLRFIAVMPEGVSNERVYICLLYTSDAADERSSVDLGGRRIIHKNKHHTCNDITIQATSQE